MKPNATEDLLSYPNLEKSQVAHPAYEFDRNLNSFTTSV